MLVFGDPQYEIETRIVASKLLDQLENLHARGDRDQHSILTSVRDLLIGCGQLEQGIADCQSEANDVMKATDLAADLFLANVRGSGLPASLICALREVLTVLTDGLPEKIRIKIPEGFAFYCLYPEQYIIAAENWIRTKSTGNVLLIGIRSIGTSLSALVRAVLRAALFACSRMTVRPGGPPFQRAAILTTVSERFDHALIIDEGPGLSGSSMASVAEGLLRQGITSITFLPAHRNGPGPAASIEVKEIWNSIPSVAFPFGPEMPLGPISLKEKLEAESRNILHADKLEFTDFSGGNWRKFVFRAGSEWPPTVPIFERTKYLFRAENGRGVLWKFAGLGAGPDFEPQALRCFRKQTRLHKRNFAAEPLKIIDGFLGCHWHAGQALTRNELDGTMIQKLAGYLMDAAEPMSETGSFEQAVFGLSEMISCNLKEALGESVSAKARAFVNSGPPEQLQSYGDGRMAPHEWIRTHEGTVLKTDCWGHRFDHTCIGGQSVLWDVAGAILEWHMNPNQASFFIDRLSDHGLAFPPEALTFYLLGYASFRIGLLSMTEEAAGRDECSYFLKKVREIVTTARRPFVQFLNCTS